MTDQLTEVVTLVGDVDVEARAQTRGSLAQVVAAPRAVVDLTRATYIDSAGITELLLAYRQREASGADRIRLVAEPGSNVARLIALAGLDQVFGLYESVECALKP